MNDTDEQQHGFEIEFQKIADEHNALSAANAHGLAYPGETLQEMGQRASDRADRLINAALTEFARTRSMSADTMLDLLGYVGRVYGPRALFMCDYFKALAPDAYAEAVPTVWSLAEYPGRAMSRQDWRKLWAKAGFTVDHVPADRPTNAVRVWRSSWAKDKGNMSWTDDRERAEWFLKTRFGKMRLYTVLAPPANLLARIHEAGRGESEWIVDTRGLKIEIVEAV
jgi:hypothetical protein